MATKSLRPNMESYGTLGIPTEAEIVAEQARLDKLTDNTEKKRLRRVAHPADVNDLAELVEQLTTRLLAVEGRLSTLEGRPK